MKRQRHFDPMTPRLRQISTVWNMIEDLKRTIDLLGSHLATENDQRGGAELLLARAVTLRRSKLTQTVRTLEQRLADLRVVSHRRDRVK